MSRIDLTILFNGVLRGGQDVPVLKLHELRSKFEIIVIIVINPGTVLRYKRYVVRIRNPSKRNEASRKQGITRSNIDHNNCEQSDHERLDARVPDTRAHTVATAEALIVIVL